MDPAGKQHNRAAFRYLVFLPDSSPYILALIILVFVDANIESFYRFRTSMEFMDQDVSCLMIAHKGFFRNSF